MKKLNLTQFIRNDIVKCEEYKAVPSAYDLCVKNNISIEKVNKLDAGENLYGFSKLVTKTLFQFKGYQFYPDPEYKQLRETISKYVGIDKKYIVVGSGGDELIDLILRLVLDPNDQVINCPPTFGSYSSATILNRGVVVNIPRRNGFSINLNAILKTADNKVKIIFICNPNNPTGNVTSIREIKKILNTQKLVLIDEAYFEFYGKTTASLVKKYDNLVVLRSFSKWAGIAGLRLGYLIMSPYLVQQIMKIKQPYNVNVAAEIAGLAVLDDKKYRQFVTQTVIKERERMYQKLKNMDNLKVYKSRGNFLFVQTKQNDFIRIKKVFKKNNIAVRYYDSFLTGKGIRITIGFPKQNNQVLQILNNI